MCRSAGEVSIVAEDVRKIETLPQRIKVESIDISVTIGPAHAAAWIDPVAPDQGIEIVGDHFAAQRTGLGLWGLVELDPWSDGRRVGVDVARARVRGHTVNLPERFHRCYRRELNWLPESTSINEICIVDRAITIAGTIERYSVKVDVAQFLADLSAKQAGAVIRVLFGD